MAIKRSNLIRRYAREFLSVLFWLHAIYAFGLFPSARIRSLSIHEYWYNAIILAFIAYYSFLAESGWFSVAFDIGYVYLWPLIVFFHLAKISAIQSYKWIRDQFLQAQVASGIPVEVKPTISNTSTVVVATPTVVKEKEKRSFKHLLRPTAQFIVLWALVMLRTKSPLLTVIALLVVFVGALRAGYNLYSFMSNANSWIDKLKGSFASQITNHIREIREWQESNDVSSIKNTAEALYFYEKMWGGIAKNKTILARWTRILSVVITIPFYLYVSLMFAFMYLAIARIYGIGMQLQDAITDSIFIPFAFTDLPHVFWVRLLGGLQATTIAVLGYNILTERFAKKIEGLADEATEIQRPLKEQALQDRIILIRSRAALLTAKPKVKSS